MSDEKTYTIPYNAESKAFFQFKNTRSIAEIVITLILSIMVFCSLNSYETVTYSQSSTAYLYEADTVDVPIDIGALTKDQIRNYVAEGKLVETKTKDVNLFVRLLVLVVPIAYQIMIRVMQDDMGICRYLIKRWQSDHSKRQNMYYKVVEYNE